MSLRLKIAAAFTLLALNAPLQAETPEPVSGFVPEWVPPAMHRLCELYRSGSRPQLPALVNTLRRPIVDAKIERSEAQMVRARFTDATGFTANVTTTLPGEERQRVLFVGSEDRPDQRPWDGRPVPIFMLVAGADCVPASGDVVVFDDDGRPDRLVRLTGRNLEAEREEDLNPPVPEAPDPGGIRVVHVDTGVAYDLPEIAARLARDEEGRILGYDFADEDDRPYDRDPGQPALFARQHGTGVASVLLAEAGEAALVPFRYPGNDAAGLARLPAEAARRQVRIVMLPIAGYRSELWQPFAEAAAAHPDILFIVSAGNDGRDIGEEPIYPAGFGVENMLVVTSAEQDGHLARGANWSEEFVDLAVPAERIDILSPTGMRALGSGSSYAVSRVAALAVRLLTRAPELDTAALKAAILQRAEALPETETRLVSGGWLRNPAAEP